jgi:hypothetical protein
LTLLFFAAALTTSVAVGCGGTSHQSSTGKRSGKFPIALVHPDVQIAGIPKTVPSRLRGHGALLLSPSRLAFMTTGSVNCAWWPKRLTVVGPSAIQIDMRVNGRVSTCDSGVVSFPIAVKIPRGINVCSPVTVRLAYAVRLPGGGGTRRSNHTALAPAITCHGASRP